MAAVPSALIHGEAGRARVALHTELFPCLLPLQGAFSNIFNSLVQENFFCGQAPRFPNYHGIARRQVLKALFFWKELEDQNLLLLRNIHIHRCALKGHLALLL